MALRRDEAAAAEAMCARAEEFRAWQAERAVVPRSAGCTRARGAARGRGGAPVGRTRSLRARPPGAVVAGLVGKLLHSPTTRLRESATGPDGVQYAETALDLFGLADDPE